MDISRTVGWFTSVFPVRLHLEKALSSVDILKSVKEQLRSIPNRGMGYGLLRYLNQETAEKLKGIPQSEVSFNYLGQFDQTFSESSLFELAKEPNGSAQSLQGRRSYLIEINGLVTGGRLQMDWTYSEAIHKRETVESLAESFMKALRSLINYDRSPEPIGFTPSDFSDFNWSQWNQSDIDDILTAIGEA